MARRRHLAPSIWAAPDAIDGTTEDVPDTPHNAAVFGRHRSQRARVPFPSARRVSGRVWHARPGRCWFLALHTSERVGGFRMLRSLEPGMLVMWDRGFHDYDMIVQAHVRGAHV